MGIEQEVKQVIKKKAILDPSLLENSILACKELRVFYKALELIENSNNSDINLSSEDQEDFGAYPSLNKILLAYKNSPFSVSAKKKAIQEIYSIIGNADEIFRERGYDSTIELEWFRLHQEYLRLSSSVSLNLSLAPRLNEIQDLMSQYERPN